MKIINLAVGQLQTNCYIVYSENTKDCIIIDPGDEAQRILSTVDENNLKVKYIVLTHGHFDHIGAVREVQNATGALVVIHKDDASYLADGRRNLSSYIGIKQDEVKADKLLSDGDTIEVGDMVFKVIHTPGHTPGGICILKDNLLFTGDTLFDSSIGRTDFPYGSLPQLIESIKNKLYTLDADYVVYPGHEGKTTLDKERRHNPYVRVSDI